MNIQTKSATSGEKTRRFLDFDDNSLLVPLYGRHDENLVFIENELDVLISCRGNRVVIEGSEESVDVAEQALNSLYEKLKAGNELDRGDLVGAVRMAEVGGAPLTREKSLPENITAGEEAPLVINTRKRTIMPRTPAQAIYMKLLMKDELVFGIGPAGTGKTYLAVANAVAMLLRGEVDRIIVSRPAVEAGENLGFLPGDMREKVDPYLRPIYDALHDTLPAGQVEKRIENGHIEIAPLAFMRGRTLANAYVILDEAQNTTPMQMKMFLTRFGEGSRMVVAGDPSQVDLPGKTRSGLADALDRLQTVEGISICRFGKKDVMRHPLVGRIVEAYDEKEAAKKKDKGQRSDD